MKLRIPRFPKNHSEGGELAIQYLLYARYIKKPTRDLLSDHTADK